MTVRVPPPMPRARASMTTATRPRWCSARFPGYTGTFLSFVVPVTVWDGNGAGP